MDKLTVIVPLITELSQVIPGVHCKTYIRPKRKDNIQIHLIDSPIKEDALTKTKDDDTRKPDC